jgi:hypothetical protein
MDYFAAVLPMPGYSTKTMQGESRRDLLSLFNESNSHVTKINPSALSGKGWGGDGFFTRVYKPFSNQ